MTLSDYVLQFEKLFDTWSPMIAERGQFCFSSSFEQRALITQAINPSTREKCYGVREGNWEKVMRNTGAAYLKDSGPRYVTNIEPVTHIFVGPPVPLSAPRPMHGDFFPFWSDRKIPQGIQDELRALGFRPALNDQEMYKVLDNTTGEVFAANIFEKGRAFGEVIVSSMQQSLDSDNIFRDEFRKNQMLSGMFSLSTSLDVF